MAVTYSWGNPENTVLVVSRTDEHAGDFGDYKTAYYITDETLVGDYTYQVEENGLVPNEFDADSEEALIAARMVAIDTATELLGNFTDAYMYNNSYDFTLYKYTKDFSLPIQHRSVLNAAYSLLSSYSVAIKLQTSYSDIINSTINYELNDYSISTQ